jgi:hypothetical protein
MRYVLPLLLLSCGAPATLDPGEPLFDHEELLPAGLPTDASPPPPTMQLEVNNVYGNDYARLHITGATPGALLRIAHARSLGEGPCPPSLGGLCLSLVPPVRVSATATVADDEGEAWFAFRVPAGRNNALALQVAVTGGAAAISNPAFRIVGPQGGAGPTDQDLDNDGYSPDDGDCADFDPSYGPEATDMLGDGADQNCDNADGVDDDGDGYPSIASGGADCDDLESEVSPEGIEVCNGIDDDCDTAADPIGTCADCDLPWGGTISHADAVDAWPASTVPWNGTCTAETRVCDDGTLTGSNTAQTCTVTPPLDCALPWGGTLTHGSSVTAYAAATVPAGGTCTPVTRACTNGVLSGSGTAQTCTVLAPTQEYMGCYHDNLGGVRDMTTQFSNAGGTVETCVASCRNAGFAYAGAQFGTECFCGNSYGSQGLASHHGRGCDRACPGNSAQTCGGTNANSVYATSPPVPKVLLGCYRDNTSGVRDLPANQGALSYNNVGFCTSKCRQLGYSYAGVQFGSNCFCGDVAGSQGNSVAGGVSCGHACSGAASENCGGSNANAVYQVEPVVQTYLGCFADLVGGARDLPHYTGGNAKNNTLWCVSTCRQLNYTYAGVQNGNECWCGNSYGNFGTAASQGRTCNMACPGASAENCGGAAANGVYQVR